MIRYQAHPDYWEGKATIDNLIFAITPDASVRWQKLQAGECHVMPYPNPADLDAMRNHPDIQVLEQEGLNVGYLAFNTEKEPFTDDRVRQALNMAVNKEAIIEAVFQGAGTVAKNPIPPTIWSYNDSVEDYPYDPEQAKKLLEEAGDRPISQTNIWAMPVQRPVQSQCAAHGRADPGRLGERRGSGRDRDLRMGRVPEALAGRRAPDPAARVDRRQRRSGQLPLRAARCACRQGRHQPRALVPQPFDELIIQAKSGPADQAERTRLYEEAQVIFKEQAPWITIAHSIVFMPMRKEVVGYKIDPFGGHYFYGVDLAS